MSFGTDFYYNDRWSHELGVSIAKINNDFATSKFLPDKEIIEEQIPFRDQPYYFGARREPLSFSFLLTCVDDEWTLEKRREIARWLDTDDFALFYTEKDPEKRYYCQYAGGIDLHYNWASRGFIEITMRLNTTHAFSPFMTKEIYSVDGFDPAIDRNEDVANHGDSVAYPELWIQMNEDGDVHIENLSAGGVELNVVGLLKDENLYIDMNDGFVESDFPHGFRYENMSGDFFLDRGVNRVLLKGNFELLIRWQGSIKG